MKHPVRGTDPPPLLYIQRNLDYPNLIKYLFKGIEGAN